MCALCGAFGITEHWTDDAAGPGAGALRQHRVAVANRFLAPFGISLSEWAGGFVLTSRTGAAAVLDSFGALWPTTEKLAGRPCDPLDPALIASLGGDGDRA